MLKVFLRAHGAPLTLWMMRSTLANADRIRQLFKKKNEQQK
jgi:hypothetical protein